MTGPHEAYVGAIAYRLGGLRDVREPTGAPEPPDAVDLLVAKGVESYARFDEDPAATVVPECVAETLASARLAPGDVDTVLFVTESYGELFAGPAFGADTDFRARRNRLVDLLDALGLHGASLFSTTYGGSCNFLQALYLARPLVQRGGARRILVVCVERHPPGVQRFMEQAVAMTGDGVATCVVSDVPDLGEAAFRVEHAGLARYRPVATPDQFAAMVLEMYRSTKSVAADCYEAVRRQPGEYAWLVFNNYNEVTTKVFAALLGFAEERAFRLNATRTGHIPACDPLVNLADLVAHTGVTPGDALLLYANGPVSCGAISLVHESRTER